MLSQSKGVGSVAKAAVVLAVLGSLLWSCSRDSSDAPAPAPLQVIERAATLDGANVRYLDVGSGEEALVLVHGWASTSWTWHRQLPHWGALGRVLAVDLPGHGGSGLPANREVTLDLLADGIRSVMDHAGVSAGVVVGHSNGAPVALRFYRLYPERTRALVALDGALLHLMTPEMAEGFASQLRADDYRVWTRQMIRSMPGGALTDEDREGIVAMSDTVSQGVMVSSLLATTDPTRWVDGSVDVPVLALMVEQPTWTAAYEAAVRGLGEKVDYVVWSDAHHFLMLEKPAELQSELASFLGRHTLLGHESTANEPSQE